MSKFPHAIVLAVAAVALCAGCSRTPAPTTTKMAAASSESRVLCLADPAGSTPVDFSLRAAQSSARQLPNHPEFWVAIGRGWVRKARLSADPGFYLNVDGCAGEALAVVKGFVPALELRTLVLMNNHQFEAARVLAQSVLRSAPESAIASGTLSDALLELGRYPEAAQAVQRQMDIHPGMAANTRASYLNWLMGDLPSAKLFIRDALLDRNGDDPESAAWTFVEAGMMYWQQGDYAGADAIFSEALNWVPNYPAALVGRGRVCLARGQASAAIVALSEAQRRHPSLETAWLLGDAFRLSGDEAQAQQAYLQVERQGQRGDKLNLGLFLATQGQDAERALRLIEEERRTRAGIYVDDAYAWALYRAQRLPEADRASNQALRLGTQDARLLYHAGAIKIALGEKNQGRQLIRQALALNPGFDLTATREAHALLGSGAAALARN